MIRLIAKEVNVCGTVHAGLQPYTTVRTFDIECTALEEFLRHARTQDYGSGEIIGFEFLPGEEGKQ